MSMLNNLKKTKPNAVFLEDEDEDDFDVDNMDFPLPTDSSSTGGATGLEDMMAKLSAGQMQRPDTGSGKAGEIAVVNTPQGVQRLDPSVYKRWVCVYPCYIDAEKSLDQGRKIPKAKAVNKPHAYHMALAVQKLGNMSVVYEGKKHPADWANPGRVRVQLKNGHFFCNPKYTSRKQLILAIADALPEIQKQNEIPKHIVSPLTSLKEIEELANEQRKAQGLPPIESSAPPPTNAGAIESAESSNKPKKVKKQKMKKMVVRR
ncbi:hypothetical protein NQZ79_g1963 [Umbelopsis isabellina]|nr:hypothetical protein NQZ79_g1963 [Umbelopsis isabellina]